MAGRLGEGEGGRRRRLGLGSETMVDCWPEWSTPGSMIIHKMVIIYPHPLPFGSSIDPLRVEETLVVFLHGSEERCVIAILSLSTLAASHADS